MMPIQRKDTCDGQGVKMATVNPKLVDGVQRNAVPYCTQRMGAMTHAPSSQRYSGTLC